MADSFIGSTPSYLDLGVFLILKKEAVSCMGASLGEGVRTYENAVHKVWQVGTIDGDAILNVIRATNRFLDGHVRKYCKHRRPRLSKTKQKNIHSPTTSIIFRRLIVHPDLHLPLTRLIAIWLFLCPSGIRVRVNYNAEFPSAH